MKIVRVRISGWVIKKSSGNWWVSNAGLWTPYIESARIFKRIAQAEQWIAEHS